MSTEIQEQVRKLSGSAAYRSLVRRRRRVTYLLTVIGILQFGVYFGAIAWFPGLSGMNWPDGSPVSVIVWLTVLVILLSIAISAVYTWWTGRYFDPERDRILNLLHSSSRPPFSRGQAEKPESSGAEGRPEGDTVFHRMPGQARHDEE